MNKVVDCHVNIWNRDPLTKLWLGQMACLRPDAATGVLADADTLFEAMQAVSKAIVFPIRFPASAGGAVPCACCHSGARAQLRLVSGRTSEALSLTKRKP